MIQNWGMLFTRNLFDQDRSRLLSTGGRSTWGILEAEVPWKTSKTFVGCSHFVWGVQP